MVRLLIRQADQGRLVAGSILVADDVLYLGNVEGELFHEGLQKDCRMYCILPFCVA